jgi:hypothetical protein
MAASRLFQFATVLTVPVTYFFEDLPGSTAHTRKGRPRSGRTVCARAESEILSKRETLILLRGYYNIQPMALRRQLLGIITKLAGERRPPGA